MTSRVTHLDAECPDAGADLGEVEHASVVQRVGGEDEAVWDAELLHEVVEGRDPLLLPHHPHRLDLRRLEGPVVPVDVTGVQRVDESRQTDGVCQNNSSYCSYCSSALCSRHVHTWLEDCRGTPLVRNGQATAMFY